MKKIKQPEIVIDASGPPDKRCKTIMDYYDKLSPQMRDLIKETGVNPSMVFAYLKWGMPEEVIMKDIRAQYASRES